MENETRVYHFAFPAFLIVIGGLFTLWPVMAWVGWVIVFLAFVVTGFLIWRTWFQGQLEKQRDETNAYVTVIETEARLRVAQGLEPSSSEVTLKLNKTSVIGSEFSMSFRKAPLDPTRMKMLAMACLDGRKLSVREWTPRSKGKLLSRDEWDRLIAFLLCPDPDSPDLAFIIQKGDDPRTGYDWTEEGDLFLRAVVKDSSIKVEDLPVRK